MRKRSNAFESDSLQNYLKLAILSQKHQNHFSRGKVLEKEEEKHEYMSTSRRYSIDFDYESPKSPDSYQMFSNSFPPKDENELFKPKKIANGFLKRNSKEIGSFEENSSNSIFSQKNLEKEIIITHFMKIMVIGEKSTGKKSLIHMLFRRSQQLKDENLSAFTKGLSQNSCFDLICKSIQMNEEEKITYKFWIQNLSNEKFDDIINVYYKTVSLFIFVYDVSKPDSLEKIQKVTENIKRSLRITDINAILVAMNAKHLEENDLDFSEAEDLNNRVNFHRFFKNMHGDDEDNAKILEYIYKCKINSNLDRNIGMNSTSY